MPAREVKDTLQAVRDHVAKFESQGAAAAAMGISTSYLSDILNERRDISDRVLAAIGLKRIAVEAS